MHMQATLSEISSALVFVQNQRSNLATSRHSTKQGVSVDPTAGLCHYLYMLSTHARAGFAHNLHAAMAQGEHPPGKQN